MINREWQLRFDSAMNWRSSSWLGNSLRARGHKIHDSNIRRWRQKGSVPRDLEVVKDISIVLNVPLNDLFPEV